MTADVLTNTNVQSLYSHITNLHTLSDKDVSAKALKIDIQATYRQGEKRADELCNLVDYIANAEDVEPNALRDSVQKFVQRELLAQAGRTIATSLGGEHIDVQAISALISRAVDVGESVNTEVMDALESSLPGEGDDRPGITNLGLSPELDAVLGGGVAAGELLVFVAPPARGKTSYLCAVGARAAAAGRKVLHVTLEVPFLRVNRRYDSAWSQMTRKEMIERPNTVGACRREVREAGGRVIIKDWSYVDGGCSPADIKALVRRLRGQGIDIDFLIVDYLELMSPNRQVGNYTKREMRHVFGQQIKEMRSTSVALQIPAVTAWQINRIGSEADTVTMAHVSECYDLNKHADIILGLNQSIGEANNNQMRIGVLKQRSSTARPQIYVRSDLDRCTVLPINTKEESPDENATIDATAEVENVS